MSSDTRFTIVPHIGLGKIFRWYLDKMANLKTGVSRKQSASNFPKNEYFLPPDTHTYQGVRNDAMNFTMNFLH